MDDQFVPGGLGTTVDLPGLQHWELQPIILASSGQWWRAPVRGVGHPVVTAGDYVEVAR